MAEHAMDDDIIRDALDKIRLRGGVPALENVEAFLRGKAAALGRHHPEAARVCVDIADRILTRQITRLPERRTLAQIAEEKRRAFCGLDPKGGNAIGQAEEAR